MSEPAQPHEPETGRAAGCSLAAGSDVSIEQCRIEPGEVAAEPGAPQNASDLFAVAGRTPPAGPDRLCLLPCRVRRAAHRLRCGVCIDRSSLVPERRTCRRRIRWPGRWCRTGRDHRRRQPAVQPAWPPSGPAVAGSGFARGGPGSAPVVGIIAGSGRSCGRWSKNPASNSHSAVSRPR